MGAEFHRDGAVAKTGELVHVPVALTVAPQSEGGARGLGDAVDVIFPRPDAFDVTGHAVDLGTTLVREGGPPHDEASVMRYVDREASAFIGQLEAGASFAPGVS